MELCERGEYHIKCRYSGVNDKNGKKIFEYDIIKDKRQKIGFVNFLLKQKGFYINYPRLDKILGDIEINIASLCGNDLDVEVIGNVFDNPELIDNVIKSHLK